jgi:hypothetical protein
LVPVPPEVLLLPEPVEPVAPDEEPEPPRPPLEGEVVDEEPALPPVVEDEPPAPAALPDLLKWESHSEREICPSPFVSTDEKLGAAPDMPLAPLVLEPEPSVLPEPVVLLPEPVVALPEPVVLLPEPVVALPDPVVLLPEPVVAAGEEELDPLAPVEPVEPALPLVCAQADVATNAAATAALMSFNVMGVSCGGWYRAPPSANAVPAPARLAPRSPASPRVPEGRNLPCRGSSFNRQRPAMASTACTSSAGSAWWTMCPAPGAT